jgi:HSP20 family molecular chaperone IbpA
MRTYDFTPLWRSTIGFDRFFDLVDAAQHAGSDDNYPPCNVERLGEDRYQISLALAGFAPDEIAITAEQNVLTVEGRHGRDASVDPLMKPRRIEIKSVSVTPKRPGETSGPADARRGVPRGRAGRGDASCGIEPGKSL